MKHLHRPCSVELRLDRGERNALRAFTAFDEFAATSKLERIGTPSMRSLVRRGLAVEGENGIHGPTFLLTPEGRKLAEELWPRLGIRGRRGAPRPSAFRFVGFQAELEGR
jgi:hypothetical protein